MQKSSLLSNLINNHWASLLPHSGFLILQISSSSRAAKEDYGLLSCWCPLQMLVWCWLKLQTWSWFLNNSGAILQKPFLMSLPACLRSNFLFVRNYLNNITSSQHSTTQHLIYLVDQGKEELQRAELQTKTLNVNSIIYKLSLYF